MYPIDDEDEKSLQNCGALLSCGNVDSVLNQRMVHSNKSGLVFVGLPLGLVPSCRQTHCFTSIKTLQRYCLYIPSHCAYASIMQTETVKLRYSAVSRVSLARRLIRLADYYYKFEITCQKYRRKILPTPSKRFKTLPSGTKIVR